MKVLVIGGGGREHAIVDALSRSEKVTKIYAAPGNAGIALQAECVAIKDSDIENLLSFAKENEIDLTVVGPEAPLSKGVVDRFEEEGLTIFGPSAAATEIESSKKFAKEIMTKAGIPTAAYQSFSDYQQAYDYIMSRPLPAVIKYNGLAAGKGVVIAEDEQTVKETLKDMLVDEKYGNSSVVIEDFLTGPEFSLMCFVSGTSVMPMVVAQDHKRAYEGDKGPNTGGMGAYSPVPFITQEHIDWAVENIMKPCAQTLKNEGYPFYGVLYGGLMLTPNGIKVIEFNARFGDPETEVVLPRLTSDIVDIFMAVAKKESNLPQLTWDSRAALGVVLASNGYPGSYAKGVEIKGIDDVDAKIYHMGTAVKDDKLVSNGGRVIFVTSLANNLLDAREYVNNQMAKIDSQEFFYRKDIAHWCFDK